MEVPSAGSRHRQRWLAGDAGGAGRRVEAKRRKIELFIVPTEQAIEVLKQNPPDTNAILHVTC